MNQPQSRQLLAVFSVSAGMMLFTVNAGILSVALPFISRELNIGSSASVLLVVVYNLVLAMTLLPFASLGERMGLKQMFVWGLLLYLLGTSLCFLANSLEFLLVAPQEQRIGHQHQIGADLDASLLDDGTDRADQVLVGAHSARDAAEEDANSADLHAALLPWIDNS